MTRTIPTNGLAIRYALACTIPPLRAVALAHVEATIREHSGHAGRIAEALGIDRRTYMRLRESFPELAKAHERAAKKST